MSKIKDPQFVVTEISASTKVSVQVNGTHYTIQYGETRALFNDADVVLERKALQDTVYDEVYKQIQDIES